MPSDLHRTPSLMSAGYTYDEIRRMLRSEELSTVRRGTYLAGGWSSDGHQRHRVTVRAAVPEFARGAVISHISAAVLHGLPTWAIPLNRVHLTRRRPSGGRRSANVHEHVATLADDEVVCLDGMTVTSLARTVIDVARTSGFEQSVVVATQRWPMSWSSRMRWPGRWGPSAADVGRPVHDARFGLQTGAPRASESRAVESPSLRPGCLFPYRSGR